MLVFYCEREKMSMDLRGWGGGIGGWKSILNKKFEVLLIDLKDAFERTFIKLQHYPIPEDKAFINIEKGILEKLSQLV